ncbi:MAG TPA: DUF3108 domain-containing protein [Blastocatellia bacterium]|nr:DUF3108 domain-containing protein [Blastocatellia bacterium]
MFRSVMHSAALILLALNLTAAQTSPEKLAFTPPPVADPLPFKIGETLYYNVNFSKLIFSGTIGELKLMVSKPLDPTASEMIELKAEAVSKGFFPTLFGVKVKDHYTSLVNLTDFGVMASTKLIEEGKVRREQKSVVNRQSGLVTYTDRDLSNSKNPLKVKERTSPTWIQDLLSTVYFVRAQPLKEGDVIPVPISDGGEIYNIEVVAGKREEIKAGGARFKAIQLNAKVFDGRYLKRSGEMLVWVADDQTRVPLRARIKTSGATITVDLKRMPGKAA